MLRLGWVRASASGDLAAVDQLLDVGVVDRHLRQLAVVEPVGAGVADVEDHELRGVVGAGRGRRR